MPHLRTVSAMSYFPFPLISSIFLITFFPAFISTAVVTLDSMKIYKTHELFKTKPTVYFHCKGENKTELPDVKEVNVAYTFKGEESWQPLTLLTSAKCKRCGFYEEDKLKSDDVFDEWEFCASDFSDSDSKFTRKKKGEFDATFLCPQCVSLSAASNSASRSHSGRGGMHVALVILISVLVSAVLILGMVAAYKFWQKKKRQQDQARFMKLFEEGDDIEDELGLGSVI